MKGKIRTLIILVMVLCLPLTAPATEEHNFAAGSLIIPMDSYYQPSDEGGLLEAFGLVYYLLAHKDGDDEHDIKIYWVINQQKTAIDGIDMTIADNSVSTVMAFYDRAGGTIDFENTDYARPADNNKKISYAGGVFIVEEEDTAAAKTLIDGNRPAVADQTIVWDGTNNQGGGVSAGIYFYEARTGGEVQVRKMALVK